MPKKIDISGRRFVRLVAISIDSMHKIRGSRWLCQCDCGKLAVVSVGNLTSGNSKSCGCLRLDRLSERATRHGETAGKRRSSEYKIWGSLIQRCTNPKSAAYSGYGGRGIDVCDEWRSFDAFLRDMGRRPSPEHSIDRKNNDRGYNKENCRWSTSAEQSRNTRRNRRIETPGGPMLLCDAALKYGFSQQVLWKRLDRGWKMEDLFMPLGTYTVTRQGVPIIKE